MIFGRHVLSTKISEWIGIKQFIRFYDLRKKSYDD